MSRLQPAMLPVSEPKSSTTYSFQSPLGSLPLKPPSADPYGPAGAGAGNELAAEKFSQPRAPSDWFDGL
jgi:hypothetical protein